MLSYCGWCEANLIASTNSDQSSSKISMMIMVRVVVVVILLLLLHTACSEVSCQQAPV